jgi:hypothetical protein
MRASRAVCLSVLTVGLTVGGISAAAADASPGHSTYSTTGTASGSGSVSTTAHGVKVNREHSGVTAAGRSYDDSYSLCVDTEGVTHEYSYESSHVKKDDYGDKHRSDEYREHEGMHQEGKHEEGKLHEGKHHEGEEHEGDFDLLDLF